MSLFSTLPSTPKNARLSALSIDKVNADARRPPQSCRKVRIQTTSGRLSIDFAIVHPVYKPGKV